MVAAASSSQSDISSGLDKYFKTHGECAQFFDMPANVRIEKGLYRIGQLDAFVAAGILQRTRAIEKPHDGSGAPERYARYVPTTLGNQSNKPKCRDAGCKDSHLLRPSQGDFGDRQSARSLFTGLRRYQIQL